MNKNQNSSNQEQVDRHSKYFLSGGTFRWTKKEENIRTELLQKITERPLVRKLRVPNIWAVAAGILLLAGIVSFLRFYSANVTVPAGIHQTAMLPDGSTVEMNAESSLTYYPFWWPFERKLKFEEKDSLALKKAETLLFSRKGGQPRS